MSIGAVLVGGGGGLIMAESLVGVGGVGETLVSVIKEEVNCIGSSFTIF